MAGPPAVGARPHAAKSLRRQREELVNSGPPARSAAAAASGGPAENGGGADLGRGVAAVRLDVFDYFPVDRIRDRESCVKMREYQ
jgi:hypothetical protein